MLCVGNKRYKIANKPYDAEIEWIKSDGQAYFDTEIIGNSNIDYEIKFGYSARGTYDYIFGA